MKKKDNVISENYLERIPMRPEGIPWSTDDEGIVIDSVKFIIEKEFGDAVSYTHLTLPTNLTV